MRDLRTFLWVLFGLFVAAAALAAIPVIGSALAWILAILAFLAFLIGGGAITHDDASPPTGGGWGGSFNSYESPDGKVDLAYVYGRWVYDSLHDGWNELHPLHYMIKIGETTKGDIEKGNWPTDLGDKQKRYDHLFGVINEPETPIKQSDPSCSWDTHPELDGCQSDDNPYPEPDPNQNIY